MATLYSPRYSSHEPTAQSEITSLLPMYEDLESSLSVSLLRMPNKYASPGVYSRLVNTLSGAYPTNWSVYPYSPQDLREGVFGSHKPHPDVVPILFLEQNTRFVAR